MEEAAQPRPRHRSQKSIGEMVKLIHSQVPDSVRRANARRRSIGLEAGLSSVEKELEQALSGNACVGEALDHVADAYEAELQRMLHPEAAPGASPGEPSSPPGEAAVEAIVERYLHLHAAEASPEIRHLLLKSPAPAGEGPAAEPPAAAAPAPEDSAAPAS
mmetsp:Transcript_4329/g.14685  ORF Transcript_4329/g.14685 Transcript_4329/m.14685 type:complete len:161 (-) Transcript_4329:56-538(-)